MSTLIAYATKNGFTQKCAGLLAEKLVEKADICDLGKSNPNLNKYDKVIIGGSVYAGKMRKQITNICAKNLESLKGKKLGLFICGMAEGDDIKKQLETSFPKELLSTAVASEMFGGEFDFSKMNFIMRAMIKKISGSDKNQTRLLEENIARFAENMNNA